jgi:proteasome lid subunit RPN8/RPN11
VRPLTTAQPITLRHPDPWPDIVADVKRHAAEAYPLEACGIVVGGEYVRCDNIHDNPKEHFLIDPAITAPLMADGSLQAVVHSHPDGPNYPTYDDVSGQLDTDIPWGICSVIGDTEKAIAPHDILWWGDSLPPVPLVGRQFIWGIFTCYQLYRDWWKRERGIVFPTWPMNPDFHKSMNIFMDYREKVGLTDMGKIAISDLQIGDMLLGKVRGSFPTHCGVFVGDDLMLHHPPTGISTTTELLRWWPYVETVFRYESSDPSSVRGAS